MALCGDVSECLVKGGVQRACWITTVMIRGRSCQKQGEQNIQEFLNESPFSGSLSAAQQYAP